MNGNDVAKLQNIHLNIYLIFILFYSLSNYLKLIVLQSKVNVNTNYISFWSVQTESVNVGDTIINVYC